MKLQFFLIIGIQFAALSFSGAVKTGMSLDISLEVIEKLNEERKNVNSLFWRLGQKRDNLTDRNTLTDRITNLGSVVLAGVNETEAIRIAGPLEFKITQLIYKQDPALKIKIIFDWKYDIRTLIQTYPQSANPPKYTFTTPYIYKPGRSYDEDPNRYKVTMHAFPGESLFENITYTKIALIKESRIFGSDPSFYYALQRYALAIQAFEKELATVALKEISKESHLSSQGKLHIKTMLNQLLLSTQIDYENKYISDPLSSFLEKISALGPYNTEVLDEVYAQLLNAQKILKRWPVTAQSHRALVENIFVVKRRLAEKSVELIEILLNVKASDIENRKWKEIDFLISMRNPKATDKYLIFLEDLFKTEQWQTLVTEFRNLIDVYNENDFLEQELKITSLERLVPTYVKWKIGHTSAQLKKNLKKVFVSFLEKLSRQHFDQVEYFLNHFAIKPNSNDSPELLPNERLSPFAYEKALLGIDIAEEVLLKIIAGLKSVDQFQRLSQSRILNHDENTDGIITTTTAARIKHMQRMIQDKEDLLRMSLGIKSSSITCLSYFHN